MTKVPLIPKVLAYITREGKKGRELLVFHPVGDPEDGAQVPGGSVEDGESLEQALAREIFEETGLEDLRVVRQVTKEPFYAAWRSEWQERNVFHLLASSGLPDHWVHVVTSGTEDKGLPFSLSWVPLPAAESMLRWGQGQWLKLI